MPSSPVHFRPRRRSPDQPPPRRTGPNEERPNEGRPRDERPHDERPRSERPNEERPRDARPRDEPTTRQAYSVEALPAVTLEGVSSVSLGVSLHDVDGAREIRLWTLTADGGCWIELLDEDSAAEVYTTEAGLFPVRFNMEILLPDGALKITQIRVFEPRDEGKVAWYHHVDWQTAELTMILSRDTDGITDEDMIESPFAVRVCDEDGKWWGDDPYVRIKRLSTPPTDTTCGP